MDSYFEHRVALPNERWDTIAYRYYGDANLTSPLIRANVTGLLAIHCILPIGMVVRVPVIDPEPVAQELLPPWKRTVA